MASRHHLFRSVLAGALGFTFVLATASSAFATNTPERLSAAHTGQLWILHERVADLRQLLFIENELAQSGQTRSGRGAYLGQRTARNVGRPAFARQRGPSAANAACSKYPSPVLAQRAFLAEGGPQEDTLGLDPDGDGFACAWGAQLRQIEARERGRAVSQNVVRGLIGLPKND